MFKMTPNHLEVLIHHHVSPTPHPRGHAPAVAGAQRFFVDNGIIEKGDDQEGVFRTTPKGEAWLQMILSTPWPVRRFVDPRSGEML